jgi:hypothetical protein
MLLTNYQVSRATSVRDIGGLNAIDTLTFGHSTMNMFYSSDNGVTDETNKSSFNNGYIAPHAWVLAPKAGGLGTVNQVTARGDFAASGAMGVNGESAMTASGDLTATLQLIVSAVAALTGSGTLTANINAPLNMAASLAASGDLVGSLQALGNAVANMTAEGSMDMTIRAIGHMEADILPYTELSPESLAAAVWNSVASQFNAPGTMGEKMNDAGNGGAHPNLLNTETGDLIIPLD